MKKIVFILSVIFFACQANHEKSAKQLDSLYFGDYNGVRFDSAVAPFSLKTMDGRDVMRFIADSTYRIKVDIGKLANLEPELFSFNENVKVEKVVGEKNQYHLLIQKKVKEEDKYIAKLAVRNNLPDYGYIIVRRTKINEGLGYYDKVHAHDTLTINIIKIH